MERKPEGPPTPAEPANPFEWVGAFEKELNLPVGFFLSLLHKEDDWSSVIKLHALVEAAISHLLATVCGEKLLDVFSRLELSNAETGKLAFAKALGLLNSAERAFIRKLSEIRNDFAHDVRQAGATLAGYVASLDQNQMKALKDAIGPGVDPFPIMDPPVPELDFVRDNPKLCIWLRALFLIAWAYQQKDLVIVKRNAAAQAEKLAHTVIELERLKRQALTLLANTPPTISPPDKGK